MSRERVDSSPMSIAGGTRQRFVGAGAPRILNLPRPAKVWVRGGIPSRVNGELIDSVQESWLVEDRWWTERPLRRRYWQIVSVRGRNLILFHDLCLGGWFTQGR
jgi:hypothetical protein